MSVAGFRLMVTTTEGLAEEKIRDLGKHKDSKTAPVTVANETSDMEQETSPAIYGIRSTTVSEDCCEEYRMDWQDLELRASESGVEVWGVKHEVKTLKGEQDFDKRGEVQLIAIVEGPMLVRASSRADLPEEFQPDVAEYEALKIFKRFDKDGSGYIDRAELTSTLQELDIGMSEEQISMLLEDIDINKDGRVSYDEFLRYLFSPTPFRQKLISSLDAEQATLDSQVTVTVSALSGGVLFGPQDLPCSMTAAELKDTANLKGTLICAAGAMKDTQLLGTGIGGVLQLNLVVSLWDELSDECKQKLQNLQAFQDFEGQQCIYVLNRKDSSCAGGGFGSGRDTLEFMLMADGQILAKKHHYFGYMESNGEWGASWQWQIAAGTFFIVDADTCTVEVSWHTFAEKTKREDLDSASEKPWVARLVDDQYKPYSIIPNHGGKTDVLTWATNWMGAPDPDDTKKRRPNNFPGLRMPEITEELVTSLGMDPAHVPFWLKGDDIS